MAAPAQAVPAPSGYYAGHAGGAHLAAAYNPLVLSQNASASVPALGTVVPSSRPRPSKADVISAPMGQAHVGTLRPDAQRMVAAMNLSDGIRTRHLGAIPRMDAVISMDVSKELKKYGGDARTNQVLQRIRGQAEQALAQASNEFRQVIQDFDKARQGPLTYEEKDALDKTCKAIAKAQQDKIDQLVQNMWEMEKHRDKTLKHSDIKFGVSIGFKASKLAVSVTSAVVAPNPLSMAAAGYTTLQMAEMVKSYAQGRDQALQQLEKHDAQLAQQFNSSTGKMKKTGNSFKALLGATHIPLMHAATGPTLQSHRKDIEEFLAKSQRMRADINDWQKDITRTKSKIQTAETKLNRAVSKGELTPLEAHARRQNIDQMKGQLRHWDDKMGKLDKMIQADDQKYLFFKHRLDHGFEAAQPASVGHAAQATSMGALGADLAYIAFNISKLAVPV